MKSREFVGLSVEWQLCQRLGNRLRRPSNEMSASTSARGMTRSGVGCATSAVVEARFFAPNRGSAEGDESRGLALLTPADKLIE
jgi:hypothetical protein